MGSGLDITGLRRMRSTCVLGLVVGFLWAFVSSAAAMTGGSVQMPEPGWAAKLSIGSSVCSGEVIAPEWILTAGHCTLGASPAQVRARIHGVMVPATAVYTAPGYTSVRVKYPDLGLVQLADNVVQKYGAAILPIASSSAVASFVNNGVTAFGYGYYNLKFPTNNPKYTANTIEKSPDGAWKVAPHCQVVRDVCFSRATWAKQVTIQHGDSGGPWVGWHNGHWELLAVVSGEPYYVVHGDGKRSGHSYTAANGDVCIHASDGTVCFAASFSAGTSPSVPALASWINSHVAIQSCGSVGSSMGWGYGYIHAYGIDCASAIRVLNSWSVVNPHGWTLTHEPNGYDRFTKGSMWITGKPLGD